MNLVIMIGNMVQDPALSTTPNQTSVVEFRLATNRVSTNRATNEKREEVCFIDCHAFGQAAENIGKFFKKGKQIMIEGRLQFDSWEGKDGVKRSKHKILVNRWEFVGTKGSESTGNENPVDLVDPPF